MLGREQQCSSRSKRDQCHRAVWNQRQHGRVSNVARIILKPWYRHFCDQLQRQRFGSPGGNAKLLAAISRMKMIMRPSMRLTFKVLDAVRLAARRFIDLRAVAPLVLARPVARLNAKAPHLTGPRMILPRRVGHETRN